MPATLFSNARIFDGVSVVSECGHVLVESNRISQISLREPLSPPSDCTIVDASGCTLIPGLMDAHMHVFQDVHLLETALRYGVTTVLDLHNEPKWFQDIHAITKQRNDVADVKSACFGATIKNGWPSAIVRLTSQEPDVSVPGGCQARPRSNSTHRLRPGSPSGQISRTRTLSRNSLPETVLLVLGTLEISTAPCIMLMLRFSFIKLMQEDGHTMSLPFPEIPVPTPSLEIQKCIVDTAHENGMLTVAHALTNHSTLHVLDAGADGLAHAAIDPVNAEIVQAFKKNNAFLIPTLAVHASCTGEEQETRDGLASNLVGDEREHARGCLHITKKDFSIQTVYRQVVALKEAGIDILWYALLCPDALWTLPANIRHSGTDTSTHLKGTRAGASVHQELWLYVNRCGFTPLEALRSATSKIADRFGFSDRGRIEVGRLADVVLVSGNPVQLIDALSGMKGVWRNGERLVKN